MLVINILSCRYVFFLVLFLLPWIFITFVVGTFQNLCKGVCIPVEVVFVISEIIYYFVFRLYASAFVAFHHICYFLSRLLIFESMSSCDFLE